MYPYPVPYPPYPPTPVVVPSRPARTPQGIRWTSTAFMIYLGYLAMSMLLAILLYALLGSIGPGTPNINAILGAIVGICAVAVVFFVLAILVLVFYFLGFGHLYGGRNEFGPTHARNVRLALYLLIAVLVAEVVAFVVGAILGTGVSATGGPPYRIDAGRYYLTTAVGAVMGVVVAAFMAALLVLSVRALARPQHEMLLYAAAGLGTATPGIVGAITLLQLPHYLEVLQALLNSPSGGGALSSLVDAGFGIPALVGGGMGLVTFLLYIYVYRDVGTRLKSGELKPVLPPPMPIGPWMTGPVVPMYPGVPPYPATPPQAPPTPPPQGPAP